MANPNDWKSQGDAWKGCGNVPEFDRLHYFYGQMLGPRDFQTEQDFFRNKLKLLNRCLHGYGVVCGLEVKLYECETPAAEHTESAAENASSEQREPAEPPQASLRLEIGCGMALDPYGNELVVRDRQVWDVQKILQRQDSPTIQEVRESRGPIYIRLYYEERPHAPQRVSDPCDHWCANYETYAKLRDSVCVRITLEPPASDTRCGDCCESYEEAGVLVARVDNPWEPENREIHNEVRRPVGLYVPTTITGINWHHGAAYQKGDAETLIHEGLRVRFSRPVLVSTIKAGVVDVWSTNDWGIPHRTGHFKCMPVEIVPCDEQTTSELSFRVQEDLGSDDRVMIVIRTDFILDECCRPVDGNHLGGQVPLIPNSRPPEPLESSPHDQRPDPGDRCRHAHGLYGPWQSGNRTPGGTFESWFFTDRMDRNTAK